MRRTITTPNRFTTFIQSWQGKFPASLLLLFLIIVFFSCKDDSAFIGLKKDPRLKADYVDIPLYPSVINFHSILTQNIAGDPIARFLVGKVSDPRFGSVTATTYVNFASPLTIVTPDPASTADSIVMELALDFYQYGSPSITTQTFELHELLDTLNQNGYYSSDVVPYASVPVATGRITIDPDFFANAALSKADADTTNDQRLKISIRLPNSLGQDVLQDLIGNTAAISDFSVFSGKYKGFALVAKDCDKIFGFDPTIDYPYNARQSRIVLYYSSAGVQSHVDLPLYPTQNNTTGLPNNVVSFSSFAIDRSGSPLSGIQPSKDFKPSDGNSYVQAGSAIVSKFDLRDFYKYVDTLNNAVINSAEIITNNSITQGYVTNIRLRILDSLNNFRNPYMDTLVNDVIESSAIEPIFRNKVRVLSFGPVGTSPTIDIVMITGATAPIATDTYQISGAIITEFCQKIVADAHNPQRIKWFAIIPDEEEFRKSVNLLVLDNSTKLRIYYSQPIVKIR